MSKSITGRNFLAYLFLLSSINLSLLLHTIAAHAYRPEAGKVMASLGPYIYKTDLQGYGFPKNSRWKPGFALIAEGNLDSTSALEIGLFYLNKQYFRRVSDQIAIEETDRIYITTGYRYWWSPGLSTGLNFFSSYSMGDPRPVHLSGDFSTAPQTSARDTTEYGVDLSVRFELDSFEKFGFFVDCRYSWSLTPKEGEESNHMALFLAYRQEVEVR